MTAQVCNSTVVLEPVYQRFITIDENIHQTLSVQALSLYMAIRFEADYRKEEANIKRSAKFLYTKAKISRPQYYRCLNELENYGLIMRHPENILGEACVFLVAKDLHHFKPNSIQQCGTEIQEGVSHRDRGVSHRDTYQESFSLSSINTTNSESTDSQIAVDKKKTKLIGNQMLWDLIEVYRKQFPNNPQPNPRLIATSLDRTLRTLIKRWPEIDPKGRPLTKEVFERYLIALKVDCPNFALNEYRTESGRTKKNGLETFARINTVVKFTEDAYS